MQGLQAMLRGRTINSVEDLKREFPDVADKRKLRLLLKLPKNANCAQIFQRLPFHHAMEDGLQPEPCGRDDLSVNTGSFMTGHSESLNSRGDIDDEDLWPTIANVLQGDTPLLQHLCMGLAAFLAVYLALYALSFVYAVFVAMYAFFTSKTTLIALASLGVAVLVVRCPNKYRKSMTCVVTTFFVPLFLEVFGIRNSGQSTSNALNAATSISQVASGMAAAKVAVHGSSLPEVNNHITNRNVYINYEPPLVLVADSMKDIAPIEPGQGDNVLEDVNPEQGDNVLEDVNPEQGGGAENPLTMLRSISEHVKSLPVPQVSPEALCATAYNAFVLAIDAVNPVMNAITGHATNRQDGSN